MLALDDDFAEFAALDSALRPYQARWDDTPAAWDTTAPPAAEALTGDVLMERAVYSAHTILSQPISGWQVDTLKLAHGDRVVEYVPDDTYTSIRPRLGIYCVAAGRLKLVITRHGRSRVISECGVGQLLGLPRLVRMYAAKREFGATWPEHTKVEAVVLRGETVELRFIPMAEAFDLMDKSPEFRRFVINHVAVRFVHRHRILARFDENSILAVLSPGEREMILQLGALRRLNMMAEREGEPVDPMVTYLRGGEPSSRAALVLEGQVHQFSMDAPPRYLGKIRPGDLVGHEGMLEAAPRRGSQVQIARGSEVLEFSANALHETLHRTSLGSARAWNLLLGMGTVHAPLPGVVSFQAAHAGLDATTLAYGAAAALAHDAGATVYVVDTGGEPSFRRVTEAAPGEIPDELCIDIPIDQSAGGVPRLRIIFPSVGPDGLVSAADVEHAVRNLLGVNDGAAEHTPWIVVVHDPPDDSKTSREASQELAERLNLLDGPTFFVSDDTDQPYDLADEVPDDLTWVYRVNAAYVAREQKRVDALGYDSIGTSTKVRRVVRVTESRRDPLLLARGQLSKEVDGIDPHGIEAPRLARAFQPEIVKRSPLARTFARLARVVERRTVGLALSGGGAWGFSHIPFIQRLEEEGIPVDFVTGTSFGSVVGAIYAAGGTDALEAFVADNCTPPGEWATAGALASMRALLDSELTTTVLVVSPFDSRSLQRFIDRAARRHGRGGPPLLTTTEVPFYPVGTNLDSQQELFNVRKSIGWGVRMSSAMPPMFPAVQVEGRGYQQRRELNEDGDHFIYRATRPRRRARHHVLDGAFIANVPSRVARWAGAHFVIASNVIPPTPSEAPAMGGVFGFFKGMVENWTPQGLLRRVDDLNRGTFLQTWKGGDDQGRQWADYRVTLQPQGFQFYELWRGAEICEHVDRQLRLRGIDALTTRWAALRPDRRSASRR